MTDEEMIKELDSATRQMQMWWKNKVPPNSYPKRLFGKIQFLKGYLKARKMLKDDNEIKRVITNLREGMRLQAL